MKTAFSSPDSSVDSRPINRAATLGVTPVAEGGLSGEWASRVYGPILDQLPRVEQRLQVELQSRYESLAPLLRHGMQLGGKRLRPALVLLSGAAVEPSRVGDDHVLLGVVLEMVHTATLIHDDVLDAAERRRRFPTITCSRKPSGCRRHCVRPKPANGSVSRRGGSARVNCGRSWPATRSIWTSRLTWR